MSHSRLPLQSRLFEHFPPAGEVSDDLDEPGLYGMYEGPQATRARAARVRHRGRECMDWH